MNQIIIKILLQNEEALQTNLIVKLHSKYSF